MAPSHGKVALSTNGNSRDGLDRSQCRLSRNLPSGQFYRNAAQNQEKGVYHQQSGGQTHLHPVVNVAARAIVERGKSPAHDVNAGEGNKDHGAGDEADQQPKARTTQALTVVGRAIAAAIAAATARGWWLGATAAVAGFRILDRGIADRYRWAQSRHF